MYIRLTPEREFTVGMVARLLPRHSDVLSDFERELADTIVQRWLSAATDVPAITDAEWPVLEEIAQVMANDAAEIRRAA